MENETQTMDKATKYQMKYRSVLFGTISIILMALAIVFYENQFSFFGDKLTTVLTYDGVQVNDSFLLFIAFAVISVLMSLTGIIYAIKNRKILGFILSSLVLAGIAFTCHKSGTNLKELISKYNFQDKSSLVKKTLTEVKTTETNESSLVEKTPTEVKTTETNESSLVKKIPTEVKTTETNESSLVKKIPTEVKTTESNESL